MKTLCNSRLGNQNHDELYAAYRCHDAVLSSVKSSVNGPRHNVITQH